MSAHTPGPWVTNGLNIFGPADSRSKHENGRMLIGGVVDDMNDWRSRPCGDAIESAEFRAERLANATLIAAAPDMLEALERTLTLAERWADGVGSSHPDHDVIAEARAVIAKAKGVAP